MSSGGSSEFQSIARRFVAARRNGEAPIDYPGTLPKSLDEAYAIQDLAVAEDGDAIAGWKVGRVGEADVARYGADRLAGPIFARLVRNYDGTPLTMPVFAEGFAAAEAEFLLRIGHNVPPRRQSYSIEEATALIGSAHVGIEIASSPFPGINSAGPAVTASDFGNNHGLIVGAQIPHWQNSGFERWPVSVLIDGREVGCATTETMLDGAVGAARFLLGLLGQRGIALPAGSWISTGAVTGVHQVRPGQNVVARFGGDLAVSCRIEAAKTA